MGSGAGFARAGTAHTWYCPCPLRAPRGSHVPRQELGELTERQFIENLQDGLPSASSEEEVHSLTAPRAVAHCAQRRPPGGRCAVA